MKNTKRRIEPLSFFDHTGISGHLERMAAKGWMIEKIINTGWVYRRIEPKNIHFAVSYFPKASEFDPEPSEEQKMFHDFCAHTGWQLACTSAQLQIFYNERENPIPIETDPELELQAIHASAKKGFIPQYIALLAIALLNGAMWISNLLGDPIDLLSTPTKLFTGFAWLLFINNFENAGFSIMDENYGYNRVCYTGFLSKGGTMGECTIEIYHKGDMVFVDETEYTGMKEVILSHDSEATIYLVPAEVAADLDKYCWDFAANWVWHGPENGKFLKHFGDNQLGAFFGAPDFIDYLNKWAFPDYKSKLVRGLGCYDYEIPEEYQRYPRYNF